MRTLLILLLTLATPLAAQDREGRDTAGSWKITHQKPFGLWDSFCDERQTGDLLEERCYIRYVDGYSPHPNFGALFAFIVPGEVEFGMERGTRMDENGMRIERDGQPVWIETRRSCMRGRECKLTGEAMEAFLSQARQGGTLRFTFTDRNGQPQDLAWDLSRFDQAMADFTQQATARGLF